MSCVGAGLLLSGVGLRACGCGICVGLRVCGNDGLCGLVKQEVGRPAHSLPRGPRGYGHQPSPDKGKPRQIRSSVWAAPLCCLLALIFPQNCKPVLLITMSPLPLPPPASAPPQRGLEAQQSPWWEMKPCPMRQGLSMAKQVGESIRQPNFKAQIHRSERAEQFLLSRYVLWKSG